MFQGKSQKSFFMLFAYNQQLGSEAQAEWPLAVHQALARPAQAQALSSVKLNGIKKSADCEFWPRAWPGPVSLMMEECGSSSWLGCEFQMLLSTRHFVTNRREYLDRL